MEWCMQNVESIDMPAYMTSKFQVLCPAEAEVVVGEADEWLRERAKESGLEDKEGDVEKLIATGLPLLACRFWPQSVDPKLRLSLAKVMYWFFVFDNVMDEPCLLGAHSVASLQFCGFLLQAFFSLDSSQALVALEHVLPPACSLFMPTLAITMAVEWWADLRAGILSPRQQARFCSHFADYVLMHPKQARFKEDKEIPGLEEYLKIRLVGAAIYVVEMVAELDCGFELDEEDLSNPNVRRFNEAIGLHMALLNDYIGFAHEYEEGDVFNLLTVLHCRNNLTVLKDYKQINAHFPPPVSFHTSSAEAWAIVRALEDECITLSKVVEEWAQMHSKPGLQKYVASLGSMLVANWLFTLHSRRFTNYGENCIQLRSAENDPEGTVMPIRRILLTRPNNDHKKPST